MLHFLRRSRSFPRVLPLVKRFPGARAFRVNGYFGLSSTPFFDEKKNLYNLILITARGFNPLVERVTLRTDPAPS